MEQQHDQHDRQEPALRDDDPILNRLSWANIKVLATLVLTAVSVVTAMWFVQSQLADHNRQFELISTRLNRTDGIVHVHDSILIEINAERRREVYPVPSKPAELLMVRSPSRRARDHTEVAVPRWAGSSFLSNENADWFVLDRVPPWRSNHVDTSMAGAYNNHP